MKTLLLVLAYAMTIFTGNCAPAGYGFGRQLPRPRRGYYPENRHQGQAMMFSGFYGQPSMYGPQGSMSAFANKDMVFTNSFAGEDFPLYLHNGQKQPQDQNTNQYETTVEEEQTQDQNQEVLDSEDQAEEEQLEIQTTKRPIKVKKNKKKSKSTTTTAKPIEEIDDSDEEDDEEEEVPLKRAQQAKKSQNPGHTYFPITFGSGGNGGHPGAAVAIANAFSTGKGGVASSHATAYGDPYFSTLGNKNGNKKQRQQRQ